MAVQQGYGKMAGTDALVFAYDTGDAVNSYKGQPTTNFVTEIADPTLELSRGEFGQYLNLVPIFETHGLVPYTLSMEIKGNKPGSCLVYMQNGSYTKYGFVGTVVNITTEWQRFSFRNLTPSGPTSAWQTNTPNDQRAMLATYTTYGSGVNPTVRNIQIEYGAHETPFTAGTRSATEGLLDLTGTTSIDLSNVSFNSNAQMEFDGTDDVVTTSFSATTIPNVTIEAVVYRNQTTGRYEAIVQNNTAGDDALYVNPSGFLMFWPCGPSGLTVPTGQWSYVAVSYNGTTLTYRVNGTEQVVTATCSHITDWDFLRVGGHGTTDSERWIGKIAVAKVYNRALSAAEVQSNFKNYRKRFEGLDYYYDNTTDGGRWIRWWWYTGVGWPGHETEALGHPFGTFDSSSHYGFQRLPEGLDKEQVELLAKDGDGNIYKWDFASPSATAQQVWDSFTLGTQGVWNNAGDAWNPEVIAGSFFNTDQDAWQYRDSEGVVSFMLDDDTCDCKSTLNAGHAMCGGSGWNQTYAQPDGAYLRYGVDTLNDGGCRGPLPERTLELFYRLK